MSLQMQWTIFNCIICCVFRPAFGCCAHPKAGRTAFFSCFQPFFFILNLYWWFHTWNQYINVWKWTKKCVIVYSSKLVDMQKLVDSLRGCLEIVLFWFIFWKRQKMNKKGQKRLIKSSLTSFWVRTTPKSWSKYTTVRLIKLAAI